MSDKIRIKHVEGGSDGNMLKDCYFLLNSAGTYDFYDKDDDNPNNPLATGVKNGSTIAFNLMENPNLPWALHVSHIDNEAARGDWADGKAPKVLKTLDEGSGTFQAHAGVTKDTDEAASSATA